MSKILEYAGYTLPGEVRRLLELIGFLDTKSDLINQNLQRLYDQFQESNDPTLTDKIIAKIKSLQNNATCLADEKLEITEQIKESLKAHLNDIEQEMSEIESQDTRVKYDQIRMIENESDVMEKDTSVATYCVCGEAFESDMIKCDNKNCRIQWYHWHCMGITRDPGDGVWYCPACRSEQRGRYN